MVKERSTLSPDRLLALSYVPAARRPALAALWRLDAALAQTATGGREPMLGRIKLAWWRNALDALDRGPPPAEPLLHELADAVLPAGVTGAELAALEEGWAAWLEGDLADYARLRGAALFGLSARLLGGEVAAECGRNWALVDLARRVPDRAVAAFARGDGSRAPARWPTALRPLGMLAALASRDLSRGTPLEPEGTPARMARMLRLRLTGR